MPKFVYTAKDRKDQSSKTLSGLVEANSLAQAAAMLKRRDLVPIKVSPVRETVLKEISKKLFNKFSLAEITNFTRNLSTMITAGLPLTEALILLKMQASAKFMPIIEDVIHGVEGGENLGDCLARHPNAFSKVYVALVRAGESAGVLDRVMERLADNLEKQREFQAKVKGAMLYPIIIVTGMVGVATIMMIFVIPKMLGLYKEFGAKLPAPTQFLINVSDFMVKNLVLLLALAVGLFYGLIAFQKTAFGRKKIDQLKLKIPLLGNLQKEVALTEICRTLGLLVGAGVQIVEALNIVAAASANSVFEEGIKNAAKQVEKGFPLAKALANDENFPAIMPQLLSIGEETGKMDEVLAKIAHYFETESDEMLKGLTTAIEPLIMVILGVGVGFLIIAIIMPIYNLTSQF